jgi:hypothetical protein
VLRVCAVAVGSTITAEAKTRRGNTLALAMIGSENIAVKPPYVMSG